MRPTRHILLGAAMVFSALFMMGAGAEDAKEKYEGIQEKIKNEQERLRLIRKKEHSILGEMEGLDKELCSVEERLRKYRLKIEGTERSIRKTQAGISETKEKLQRQKEWIKRKLRALQRHGRYSDVVVLASGSEDMAELIRRWRSLETISRNERQKLSVFSAEIKALREKEAELERLRASLKSDAEAAAGAEEGIKRKREEKKTILSSVKGEKALYEKMLRELKESSERLLELIRKSAEEEESKYAGTGFRRLKGKLIWPVEGAVAVNYGLQKDPRFNTTVFRNGIYITAGPESSAEAVCEGKVIYADWFKGYGQLVIVNHGEGYNTLYANLKEIFLNVGDIIKEKGKVGKVGESGMTNSPALYFEVRYKGKPLDPTQWLRRR